MANTPDWLTQGATESKPEPATQPDWLKQGATAVETEPPARGLKGWAGDIAATALKGAVGVPEALVGLADIPTGGRVGKFLENEGGTFGFRPKQAREFITDTLNSEATKEAQRKFQEADGLWDKTKAAIQNPSLIATAVGESLPAMGLGGVAARGLLAGTRLGQMGATGAALAGATGEGVVGAGQQAEQIRQETKDGLLTPEQAGYAGLTGLTTAGFGALGGKVANRLGIGDVDVMLAEGSKGMARHTAQDAASRAATAAANPLVEQAALKSIPAKIIQGAISEGLLEELPQSVSEQIFQNLALGDPWHKDVDSAAVLGTLSGGAMGAGAAGYRGFVERGQPKDEGGEPSHSGRGAEIMRQALDQQLLALPAPTITVDGQGQASTAEDRNAKLQRAGDITDVTPIRETPALPSEAMGINPADGPLSTGAAIAVDTGASGQMQQAAALAEAVKAAPKTPAGEAKTAAPDLSGWSDQQLSDTFRAAQAPDVRRQLVAELQRRRDVREQQALRQEMDAEQAAMDMQDAPDDAFANVREDAGAPNLQDGPSHSVADGVADKGRQPTVSQQPKEASSGAQTQETQQAGQGQQEARAAQAGARDESHLNALELRLSHERGRLRAAKTDAERATRQVTVDGIEREIAGERKFLGLAPQAASAMSDDALMQALKPDGAEKTSTAQPPLSGTISPQPQAAGPALAAPEFTTIKTVHGDSVTVRTSDLQGDAPRLRQYTKAGKAKAVPAIHRDNLDLTGEKSAERAKENAKNPLFHTVTTKDGGAFASQAAAQREVNRLGLQDSHEVVEAGGGFVGRIKKTGEQHGATARNLRLADERTPGAGAAAPHGPGESVAGEAPVVGAGQRQQAQAAAGNAAKPANLFSDTRTGAPVVVPNKATADAMARSKQLSGKVAVRKATPAEMADERNAFTGYNAGENRRIGYVLEMLPPQGAQPNQPPEQSQQAPAAAEPVAPDAEQSPAQETTYNGTRIYPTKIKVGDEVKSMWAVESPDNRRRRAAGERTIGGDSLHDTIEQAKAAAEREAKRDAEQRAAKAEQDAADKARLDAEEARKAANRPKTVVERRKDAILDGPSKIGQGTKRAVITTAVDNGYAIEAKMVYDHAAKKRDQEAVDRASRAGYILGVSNENLPLVKAGNEAKARLKEGKYEKPEYRVYQGSDTKAPFREITKTEYDYAQELKAQRAAAPQAEAAQPATPQRGGNDFLPEGWTKSVNGFTKRPVYRMEQGVGQPFAVVTQTEGMTYEVQIRHGDKQLTTGAQRGALSEVLAAAEAELGRMTQADSVTHADPGEKAEAATPAVVTDSLKKAASNEDTKPSEMRKWLLGEIDKALLNAPDRADYDEAVKRMGEKDAISMYTGNGLLGKNAETGFVTFDVPGDGKFKVRNSVRGLLEFRKNASASQGFKDNGQKPVKPEEVDGGVRSGSGGRMAAIVNMIEEGDFEAARDYAEAVGIKLEDVKVPRGDMKPAWEKYLKDGTLPPAPDTRQKPAPKTAAQLDEEKRQAAEAEAKKPKDTGWNMAGTGYGGKRYIGRNITLDDGREVVARVYENAGTYEEAEVKVDGVRKFTVTDRDNAQGKADAFIRTLQDGDQAAGSAKSPTRVTPQISGNPEKFIKVAADSVRELRSVDVDRVLTETPVQFRAEVASYIRDQRKDLADEVDDVMAGIQPQAAAPAPSIPAGYKPAGEPFYRGGKLVQGYAPFAPGERVTMKDSAGQSGVVEGLIKPDDNGVFESAAVRFDNGTSQAVLLGKLEATTEKAALDATGPRRDPAKVSMFNPYEDGDIVTINGQDWTVKQDTPGWYLTTTGNWRGQHPTIRNIKAMADLIREVEQAATASPAAQPEAPKLTPAEAKSLMEWQDMGQKDGVKTHALTFYESQADKDAKRGRMIVARVTKEVDGRNWMVEGTEEMLAVLGMAKKKAEQVGMARVVADGYVAEDNPFAEYDAVAKQYGYEVRPDGAIGSDGKFPGPKMKVKGGRLRIESGSGDLLASYASPAPQSLGKFLESFWYAQKKAPVDGAGKTAEPASDRDHFTLERLNRETDRMEPVTFQRGETVKIAAGKRPYPTGVITGISHAERKFRVDGNEYGHDFGYAYKVDFDELARPRQEVDDSLNTLEQRLNEGNAIQSEGFIRSAKEVIERNNLGDYAKDRMAQLARRAADVSKSVLDKMRAAKAEKEQADAQKRAEDQAKVAEPKPPIEMTMGEWKAVSKDFKGMIDGKRTVMREGGMRFVTIIPSKAADSKTPTVDAHDALMASVREGMATPEQFKSGFEAVVAGKEAIKAELSAKTKAQLLEVGGPQVQWRHANSTKPDIVDAVYHEMLRDYALGETITHGLARDSYQNAVRKLVEATDADKLAQYVKDRQDEIAEAQARGKARAAALENPKTLDDFRNLLDAHMRTGKTRKESFLMLTPDQRIQYDTLEAESTREARENRKRAQKTEVRSAGQTTAGEIVATKHTRDGYDLFVVKLADRLSKEDYSTVLASAKKLGGWYSAFRGNGAIPGFQFRTREAAEAFSKLVAGDEADAQAVAQARRDAFEDDRSQSAVERLRAMAAALNERADEQLGRERKTNTARRARFAASAEGAALADKALAGTMNNLAAAIEAGTTKFLDAVRQKVQVEMLGQYLRSAKDAQIRAKYPSYGDQQKHRGEPVDAETVDYAEFPTYVAMRSDLASIARQMLEVDGLKQLGQRLMSVADDVSEAYTAWAKDNLLSVSRFGRGDQLAEFASREDAQRAIRRSGLTGRAIVLPIKRGQNRIVLAPSEAMKLGLWEGDGDKRITLSSDFGRELVEALGRRAGGKIKLPWTLEATLEKRKRLEGMGIYTAPEFRSALREFSRIQQAIATPDKIKEMERAMIGRANDGLDFFPTSPDVVQSMLDAAEIQDGMAVLEPSAGMGHIADAIRKTAGVDPDVVELSGARRELLEAKGYNLVGNDFMAMTPRSGFTFGDVFRDANGDLGVMRGSGSMGSGRVGFQPLDASRQPDARNARWVNRDELTGVEHRGADSGYDRIIMNPPFSDGRDIQHVQHAYELLRPGGRIVALMGDGAFFQSNRRAEAFRAWLDERGATSERLPEGSFMDPSLPVNTSVNARMVVIDKPAAAQDGDANFGARQRAASGTPTDRVVMDMLREGRSAKDVLGMIAGTSRSRFNRQVARLLLRTGVTPKVEALAADGLGKDKRGFNLLAKYSRDSNTISLTEGAGYMAEQIMLHELIHAATLRALDRKGLASLQMRRLFEHVQKHGGLAGTYGMKNVGEFTSEAFTNPEFQRALRQIAAPPGGRIKAAWDGFVRILRSILGLPQSEHSALSQALELGVAVMREDMALRQRGVVARGRDAQAGIDQTQTEAFKRWFKDSKVVDAEGKPLVVYHGTNQSFDTFDASKADSATGQSEGAFWFASSPAVSERFGNATMPVYLSAVNLFEVTPQSVRSLFPGLFGGPQVVVAGGRAAVADVNREVVLDGRPVSVFDALEQGRAEAVMDPGLRKRAMAAAKKAGADGVVFRGFYDASDTASDIFAVFRPEQIKSAIGNNGNFDPNDDDIAHMGAPTHGYLDGKPHNPPTEQLSDEQRKMIVDTFNAHTSGEKVTMTGEVEASGDIGAKSRAFQALAAAEGWTVHRDQIGAKYFNVNKGGRDGINIAVRVSDHSNVNRGIHFKESAINLAPNDGRAAFDDFESALWKLRNAGEDEDGNLTFGGDEPDYFFGAADPSAPSAMQSARAKLGERLNDAFNAPGTLSKWHTTVGTMYNLAEQQPAFKPVFDSAKAYIDDISQYAMDAADHAPTIIPRLEDMKDAIPFVSKKKPVSAADNKAIAAPIFEGTLNWARDLSGKPVPVAALEKEAAKMTAEQKAQRLLRAGEIDPGVLKAWQGMPLESYEKAVNTRYESRILKPGVAWTDAELKSQWNLNDHQVALYREYRAAVDRSIDTTTRADMLRFGGKQLEPLRAMVMDAANMDDALRIITSMAQSEMAADPDSAHAWGDVMQGVVERVDRAHELQKRGYAPLQRFGEYTVDVVVDGERQFFSLYETKTEANAAAKAMREEYGDANVVQGTLSKEEHKMLAGVTPESLELFGNMLGLASDGDTAQDKVFQEFLRRTKSNNSALRRLIHRKGTAGFSEDVGRGLASFIYSNARLTSGGLNVGRLTEAAAAITKGQGRGQGQLRDAAERLRQHVLEPQEAGASVRGFMFAQFLGGSVASAMVNLTQPMTTTLPYLSQFGGATKAAGALLKASRDMATPGLQYEKDLAEALKRAEDSGTVSPQEIHYLMGQARGQAVLRAGGDTKLSVAQAMAANAWARTKLGWGLMFGGAEQVNRRMTFIAAYRLAKAQGIARPEQFAAKAVDETQFVQNKANKMEWGRSTAGSTLMTFKGYSIAYLELMHRMWTQGGPEGKRAVLLAAATLMLLGGAGGLPFMEDAEDIATALGRMLGYNWNAKKARQDLLVEVFGRQFAQFADKGLSGLPGAPIDVSGRLGMGNLIPGTGLLLDKTNNSRDYMELLGPAGDFVSRVVDGGKQVLGGVVSGDAAKVARGALNVAPTAVRNMLKGADMAASGIYKDTKGYKVIDTTLAEAAAKFAGFQPRSVAQVQEANSFMMRSRSFYQQNSAEIKAQWADALFRKDEAALERVRERLAAWNRDNPEQPIVVKMPDVWKRVREMGKDRTQRIADTAPKALRQQMREMARENG